MAPFRLTGLCNQCGLCCELDGLRCIHLIVKPGLKVGEAGATYCRVYASRFDRMLIPMVNTDGVIVDIKTCGKDSRAEAEAIVERGIGKGCSLEVVHG